MFGDAESSLVYLNLNDLEKSEYVFKDKDRPVCHDDAAVILDPFLTSSTDMVPSIENLHLEQ